MADALSICVFDAEGLDRQVFRDHLDEVQNLEIVGEATSTDELTELLRLHQIDLVVVNLDDGEEQRLDVVSHIQSLAPGMDVLGISRKTEPQSIIAPMRAGCTQIVTAPVEPVDLRDAIQRIRSSLSKSRHHSKRICVVGSSGGVGATTIACNLSVELARATSSRVAVVDLNLEYGDTSCAFDCDPAYTVADVCKNGVHADSELLGKALHELPCGVSLLATPRNILDALEVSPEGVENMLGVIRNMFPFVLIDLPRSYSFLTASTLEGTDKILLVTQLSVPIVRNTERIYRCLLDMDVPDDKIEIVVNRSNASFEQLAREDIEAHFQKRVFAMIPNDYRRLRLSMDLGNPLNQAMSNSPARAEISTMASKLANCESIGTASAKPTQSGFWSKFWSKPLNAQATVK
jgi:pilus assembly protein CpaE